MSNWACRPTGIRPFASMFGYSVTHLYFRILSMHICQQNFFCSPWIKWVFSLFSCVKTKIGTTHLRVSVRGEVPQMESLSLSINVLSEDRKAIYWRKACDKWAHSSIAANRDCRRTFGIKNQMHWCVSQENEFLILQHIHFVHNFPSLISFASKKHFTAFFQKKPKKIIQHHYMLRCRPAVFSFCLPSWRMKRIPSCTLHTSAQAVHGNL